MPKILVVDSEKRICEFIRSCLSEDGYDVATTDNSEEAVNLLENLHFDLVLSEIVMPGTDGFKVIQSVYNYDRSTKMIAIMTYAENTDKNIYHDTAKIFGADDYVIKPLKKDDIKSRVHRLCQSMPSYQYHHERLKA